MQTASILNIPLASSKDNAADISAAGKGMHVGSGQPAKSSKSLFNKILHQGMTPREAAAGDPEQGTGSQNDTDDDVSMDVCAMLVQLNVMGAAQGEAANGAGASDSTGGQELTAVTLINPEQAGGLAAITTGMTPDPSAAVTAEGEALLEPGADLSAGDTFGATKVMREIADAMGASAQADGAAVQQTDGTQAAMMTDTAGTANNSVITGSMPEGPAAGDQTAQVQAVEIGATVLQTPGREQTKGMASASETENNVGTVSDNATSLYTGNTQEAIPGVQESGAGGSPADGEQQKSDQPPDQAGRLGSVSAEHMIHRSSAEATFDAKITEADKTSAVDKAFLKLTEDVRGLRAGSREINIVLEPESLGVLTISVVRTEHGISAKIRSVDKELVSIMSDRLQNLISSMETKGINVRDVDVAYSPSDRGTGFSQQTFSQQREQTSGGGGAPRDQKRGETARSSFWDLGAANDDTSLDNGGDTTVVYRI